MGGVLGCLGRRPADGASGHLRTGGLSV